MKPDPSRVADYLRHILEAISRIGKYTSGMSEEGFSSSNLVQDAVIRNIEIMGEAARNIELHGQSIKGLCGELPLRDIYLMRNRLAHGYFSADISIVWNTVQKDIPALKQQVQNTCNRLVM
jgi:uncharacterized protein with HEPN domain